MKKRILIIDDEKDFLKVVKLNLENTNEYEVFTLSCAKDIISHVNRFKPDLIILDLLMPVVGGIDACQMLNNDPIGSKIPIIVLSALDKDADKLKAYKAGVIDFLVKPIEKKYLVTRIIRALKDK